MSNADAISRRSALLRARRFGGKPGTVVAIECPMLKLLGSIALARLLGFGIVGFIVIYLLLSLLS
jgi:hypothetical protein